MAGDQQVVDRVDGHAGHLDELRLLPLQHTDGRHVTVIGSMKHKNSTGARIAHINFVMDGIDRNRLRPHKACFAALDHALGRLLPSSAPAESEHGTGQCHGDEKLIVRHIKIHSVHGAAQVRCLSFQNPLWSDGAVCQPGKRRDSRHAHSIGNQNLAAFRIIGRSGSIRESAGGGFGRRVANDSLR